MGNNTPPLSPGDLAVKREFSRSPSSGTVPPTVPITPPSISNGSDQQFINATVQLDRNLDSGSRSTSWNGGQDIEIPNASSVHLGAVRDHSLSPQNQQLLFSLNSYMQQDGRSAIGGGNLDKIPDDDAESYSEDSWAPGSDAEQDGFGSRTNAIKNQKKRKNQGKPSGTYARTAREWHKRNNEKIPPEKRRGKAYKEQQIANLSKSKQNTMRKSQKFTHPSVFLGGAAHQSTSAEPDHKDMPEIGAKSKGDFFNKFAEKLAQNTEIDIHKCKTDYNGLRKKSRSFGYKRMEKAGNDWQLDGMTSTLRNHQMLGTAWMIERECSHDAPSGGICADDMGVGKTVQSLALIVGNPAEAKEKVKATLVIVPSKLRNQWWREIKLHTPYLARRGKIFESNRLDNDQYQLENYEIVLTNYSELVKSLPKPDKKTIKRWKDDGEPDIADKIFEWTKKNLKKGGLLHTINWYRIVIDEAHEFKNPKTLLSRAMSFLRCSHPWLLSGTPIMNCYEEFHPLLTFIKEPISSNLTYDEFRDKYCDTKDHFCIQGLGIILSDVIIRRSTKDKIMGHFIVPLPNLSKEVREVKRYKPERTLYREFRNGLRALLNQDLGKKDERKKLTTIIPQLTRKRQLISHPDLISRQIMIVLDESGMKRVKNELSVTKLVRKSKPLERILQDRLSSWLIDLKNNPYTADSLDEKDPAICLSCNLPDEDLVYITKCGHTFCEMCLIKGRQEMEEDEDDLVEVSECPECRTQYRKETHVKPFHKSASEPKGASRIKKSLKKGKDARGFRPGLAADQTWALAWLHKVDLNEVDIFPSAKLRGVLDQVNDWIVDAPNDKIVVFTQFRLFAILVGIMLEKRGLGFMYFTGDMTLKQRDEAIEKIEGNQNIKVMIAGLKCGGTGLNFQFANRGIITDIWWNTCIDEQALGRFYRMGQKNSVHFVRIVVTKTVDSKIINLQEDKKEAICKVMQDQKTDEEKLAEILQWLEDDPDEEDDTSDEEGGDEYDSDDEDGF